MPSSSASPFQPNTLYLTLNYLRTEGRENKYHWGFFVTGSSGSGGTLYHATNVDPRTKQTLNYYYYEPRPISGNPATSRTMVVLLKVCTLHPQVVQDMDRYIRPIEPLAARARPPAPEPMWTCRVWVKYVLGALARNRVVTLPTTDVNTMERQAIITANANINSMGNAPVYNDTRAWVSAMDIDSRGTGGSRRTGGGGGTKPMDTRW